MLVKLEANDVGARNDCLVRQKLIYDIDYLILDLLLLGINNKKFFYVVLILLHLVDQESHSTSCNLVNSGCISMSLLVHQDAIDDPDLRLGVKTTQLSLLVSVGMVIFMRLFLADFFGPQAPHTYQYHCESGQPNLPLLR